MVSQKGDKHPLKKVYNTTLSSLKNSPTIFVPFIILTIVELIALVIVYLAPRMPLKLIFGPPIRTFWGERFLHYPANFLLLPKLITIARMGLIVFIGSLLSGMAIAIVLDIYKKGQVKLGKSFNLAFKNYISLFAVVFVTTASFYYLLKFINIGLLNYFFAGHRKLLFISSDIWLGPLLLIITFCLALLIQAVFVYALPAIIIGKEKLVRSIVTSFKLFKKMFAKTIILVGLPMLIYVPIIVLNYRTAFLIRNVSPESVLLVSGLGIIISSLIIDPLITVSTTTLYLMDKEG